MVEVNIWSCYMIFLFCVRLDTTLIDSDMKYYNVMSNVFKVMDMLYILIV
jgi:hypothetical protein